MEFAAALSLRRSCRSFRPDAIPSTVLHEILQATLRAPSAGNSWALDLVVLTGEETHLYWDACLPLEKREAFPWPGLLRAPVLVFPTVRIDAYLERYSEQDKSSRSLGDGAESWAVPYWWVDGGASVMSMLLAATDRGLGSLLFGLFERTDQVVSLLGIPDDRTPLGVIALGYPDEHGRGSRSERRGRPALDDIVHYGSWSSNQSD